MPTATFFIECRRILGNDEQWTWNAVDRPQRLSGARVSLYRATSEQDIADFAQAVRGIPNAVALVEHYQALRAALSSHLEQWLYRWGQDQYYHRNTDRPGTLQPFTFGDDNTQWDSIPLEFAEYLRGAAAYHNGIFGSRDWDTAIQCFEAVLALPEDQRQYRSTWAAFMLGKTWTEKDPAQAAAYFQQTRDLAARGFHDSLALADASVGWESFALLKAGDVVTALHRYAEQSKNADIDLREACGQALDATPLDSKLVDDGLARRLITAWLIAYPREQDKGDKWLRALDEFHPKGVVEDADRLAWLCYQRGDFAATQRWLDHCDPDAPYAQWVCAKLLMREGRFEVASTLLAALAKTFPTDPSARVQSTNLRAHIYDSDEYAHDIVGDDLGYALSEQGKYGDALAAYLDSGWSGAAVEMAERIMTIDELQSFVDTQLASVAQHSGTRRRAPNVKRILVGRYARAGAWEKAAALDGTYPVMIEKWLDIANNPASSVQARAQALFEVGRTIREHGPAFFNPEMDPYAFDGDASAPPGSRPARIYHSVQPYPQTNYFKYIAADYMWKSAELLPDNDVLCARALYAGGTYISKNDPKSADRFYKALVRRNPNLLVAQQARELRWFPKKFTDTVLYQPLPEHWYGRKRYLAAGIAFAGVTLGALLLALAMIIRRRSRKNAAP